MQLVFVSLLIIVGVTIYVSFNQLAPSYENFRRLGQYIANVTSGASVEVDVFDHCPFEAPDPWHESVLPFVDVKYGFDTCGFKKLNEPVTNLSDNRVFLSSDDSGYNCEGRCLFYVADKKYSTSDFVPIHNNTFQCDFVETLCKKEDDIQNFVHMQIDRKASRLNNSKIVIDQQSNPDVHIMVLDSVASTQLIRALPRTVNFLLHGFSAVEFRKFNKVGDNSRPNGFAALLGKTTEEVDRKVMNMDNIPADMSYEEFCNVYLDNETFIPSEYHKAGYMTYDAEDSGNSILRYPDCLGLKQDFLDHYYRTLHQRLKKDERLSKIMYDGLCRSTLDDMLDYLSLFLEAYQGHPKFSFFWNADVAHDDSQVLYKADFAIYNFLIKNKDELSKSFIFFFGDHGPRYGKEASTWLGRNERNNPFLYVVVPRNVRRTAIYWQLLRNSEELVTHHDLYASFLDILYFQSTSNFTDASFKRFDPPARGSSLLRAFEPGKPRNCKTLPIPFQYCICQYAKINVTDNSTLSLLGNFASSQLQFYLDSYNVSSKCEEIKLLSVEAKQYSTGPTVENDSLEETLVFDVTFSVSPPAFGEFLIPVRKRGKHLQLGGETFSRLNAYGKNGNCMPYDTLKPLCTCKIKQKNN